MPKILNAICAVSTLFLLANCSYFSSHETPLETSAPAELIDLTVAEPVQEVENTSLNQGYLRSFNFEKTANTSSNSSVEVVGVDHLASGQVDKVPSIATPSYVHDPSVQVFPLDDAMRNALGQTVLLRNQGGPLRPGSLNSRPSVSRPAVPVASVEAAPTSVIPVIEERTYVSVTPPNGLPMRLYFDHDSDAIKSEYAAGLSEIAKGYKPGADFVVSVEGHASTESSIDDPTQRRVINLKVSMDRAFQVARKLMEHGLAPKYIRAVAWGESGSVDASADGKDAVAAARRVDVVPVKLQ